MPTWNNHSVFLCHDRIDSFDSCRVLVKNEKQGEKQNTGTKADSGSLCTSACAEGSLHVLKKVSRVLFFNRV